MEVDIDIPPMLGQSVEGEKVLNVRFAVPEEKGNNADKSHRRPNDVLILEYQNGRHLDGTGNVAPCSKYEVIHSMQTNQIEGEGRISRIVKKGEIEDGRNKSQSGTAKPTTTLDWKKTRTA